TGPIARPGARLDWRPLECDQHMRQHDVNSPWVETVAHMRSQSRAMAWVLTIVDRRLAMAKARNFSRCAKTTGVGWTCRACTRSRTMVGKASSRSTGLDIGI